MTTILAAAAVMLFAVLIAVCVFFLLEYLRLSKDDEQKDEVKAQPGKYRSIADFDIQSMHPSSFISEKPFSYKYQNTFDSFYGIQKRISDLAEMVSYSQDKIRINFNEHYDYEKRIEKLENLVQQLYSDRTVDMISDSKKDGE